MADLQERLLSYRMTMAVVRDMLSEGIITVDEFETVERMLLEKYGFSSCSIFR